MKIVGVAACITGVAHTYMAQEAIEQECKKRGIECKVETQGGMGIENELEEDEIADADAGRRGTHSDDEPVGIDSRPGCRCRQGHCARTAVSR